jgi:hypothetical protein
MQKENVCKKDLGNSYIKGIFSPEILSNVNPKNTNNTKSENVENTLPLEKVVCILQFSL